MSVFGVEIRKAPEMSALDLLLGDFDRGKFFDEHWEKRSLVLKHNDPGRFSDLINREQFIKEEVHHCDRIRANYDDPNGWASEVDILPDQAAKFYEAGMTIAALDLPETGPRKKFLEAFRAEVFPMAPVHFSSYYSPHTKGYCLHFDTYPAWLMQVEGCKHWHISRKPALKNPQFNIVFPPDRDVLKLPWITLQKPDVEDPDEFWSVMLEPGDVIYMPAATWHQARAEDYSLGLTLAAAQISAFDMLIAVVQHSLPAPEFQVLVERIGGMDAAQVKDGKLSDELESLLAERLDLFKNLVSRIEVANLCRAFELLSKTPPDQMFKREPKRDV
ncbi:MAG: cupin-like domain-containing protein [Gammaproteobacteria bacterium]|nr:cupin-like domain-containing protein [Gammaproteobacteria bacterium]